VKLSRLRRGEIVALIGAVALVVLMFAVPWFQFTTAGGGHTSANAWSSLPTLRWVLLVAAASGALLAYLQASRSAPAVPVTADVIVVTFSAIVTVILLIRILTSSGSPLFGAFAGLVAIAVQTAGAFMALREEGGWMPGPDHPVETIVVGRPGTPERG
jgi:hypothetical protein